MARFAPLGLAVGALLLSGCATPLRAPVVPPQGVLVTVHKAPLQVDMERTRLGSRQGRASTWFVQDPIFTGINLSWGDASVQRAAEEGGLTAVHHTDYRRLSILGIFQQFTVYAYGE